MSDKTKMKPCPFCGSGDIAHETYRHQTYFSGDSWRGRVVCGECRLSVDMDYESEAVALWNRRVTPQPNLQK